VSGYLAVDIGGTKLAAGIVSLDGDLELREQVPTPETGVWDALALLVGRVLDQASRRPSSCGVGVGGPMTPGGETVSTLLIPEWRGFPLRERLHRLTGLNVHVANDAQALLLGEVWRGALRGERDALAMVVSTGVGGGVLSDGRLVRGRLGNAGHIGHVVVVEDGRPCACGSRGCLEAHASGTAIRAITGRDPRLASRDMRRDTGRLVGRALASVGAMFDLRRAVIGGSVALGFGDDFFAGCREELVERCGLEFIVGFEVGPVGLGDAAPLIGAGAVARDATSV
jgi:glucokinase